MAQQNLPAVWEWFEYRRKRLRNVRPNPAHKAIASWQRLFPEFTLVTQNIDGLHQQAGSHDVIELHGNIWRARCIACLMCHDIPPAGDRPEACLQCGESVRPDVVLFGEMLPVGAFEYASEKASQCELCFVVGTSAVVYPAASLPEIAMVGGAYVCEVNPERTPLSDRCNESLSGKAGELLPLLGA
jgi:NAD-dependent deacetylase